MIVTHKLTMDLTRKGKAPCIDVMQEDKYSRDLQIRVQANGTCRSLPEECTALVRFEKADGTNGMYNTMPDGSRAWKISGDTVTVRLAPQVCTAPGRVRLTVTLLRLEAELSLFEVELYVHKRLEGRMVSEDYVSVERYVPLPEQAAAGQFLRVLATDDGGRITAMEAVDAAGSGKSAYEYAVEGGFAGTEAEFAQMLAAGAPGTFYVGLTVSDTGFAPDKTMAQIEVAYQAGQTIACLMPYDTLYLNVPLVARAYEGMAWLFGVTAMGETALIMVMEGMAEVMQTQLVTRDDLPDVPTALPNPYKLKFTGAVSAAYDGTMPITVTIPTELPKVTGENNGAFLRVVEGSWAAAEMDSAEEVAF